MKKSLFSLLLIGSFFCSNEARSQEAILGEVRMFAGNFAPRGWARCDGQLLDIASNSALFSLLGTAYGGDGRTTFGLPDLRGRVPMNWGQGPGLSSYSWGQQGGTESNILTVNQLPSHSHEVNAVLADGNQATPFRNLPAGTKLLDPEYSDATPDTTMSPSMIGNTGGNQSVENRQPYVTVTFIIATQGIFPSRN